MVKKREKTKKGGVCPQGEPPSRGEKTNQVVAPPVGGWEKKKEEKKKKKNVGETGLWSYQKKKTKIHKKLNTPQPLAKKIKRDGKEKDKHKKNRTKQTKGVNNREQKVL